VKQILFCKRKRDIFDIIQNMDPITILVVIASFLSWGIGSFIAKVAANRIGTQSVFWDLIGYIPAILIYSLIIFRLKNILAGMQTDKLGIGLAMLAGAVGSLGMVGFYFLLTRAEASTVTPLTALYPALTAVLAIIFLHESVNPTKIIGIVLSIIAVYLLVK
jgi:transporter family protein